MPRYLHIPHTPDTARDWTWARLIEDGKALLAITTTSCMGHGPF